MVKSKKILEILKFMKNKNNIRNIAICAHIDAGKTTLTDSLLAHCRVISKNLAGSLRALDYLEIEQKRGVTVKTANISLLYNINNENYIINLIDTPGHL